MKIQFLGILTLAAFFQLLYPVCSGDDQPENINGTVKIAQTIKLHKAIIASLESFKQIVQEAAKHYPLIDKSKAIIILGNIDDMGKLGELEYETLKKKGPC